MNSKCGIDFYCHMMYFHLYNLTFKLANLYFYYSQIIERNFYENDRYYDIANIYENEKNSTSWPTVSKDMRNWRRGSGRWIYFKNNKIGI